MNTDKLFAEAIAAEYAPKNTRKVIALKKLDRHVKKAAIGFAYSFGTSAMLLIWFGVYIALGLKLVAIGACLGILGTAASAINPILFGKILEKRKLEYGYDILCLAEEIIEEYR